MRKLSDEIRHQNSQQDEHGEVDGDNQPASAEEKGLNYSGSGHAPTLDQYESGWN